MNPVPSTASDVFLSYARENGDFALQLGRDLRAVGLEVWIDQLSIRPGERWDEAVQRALERCRTLIVVMSPESVASPSVNDEVGFALDEGKRVVPVLYRECSVPFRWRRLQRADLSTDPRGGLEQLTRILRGSGAVEPPPEPAPGIPPGRPWWRSRRNLILNLVVLASAVVFGAIKLASDADQRRMRALGGDTAAPAPAVSAPAPTSIDTTAVTGSIEGQVTGSNGALIGGAQVSLAGTSTVALTDANGRYRFANVSSGTYVIRVRYIGYNTAEVSDIGVLRGRVSVTNVALTEASTAGTSVRTRWLTQYRQQPVNPAAVNRP